MIETRWNNVTARNVISEALQGLEAKIRLAKGCPVMLQTNFWTEKGLVNGALGTVPDILKPGHPSTDIPLAVMFKFDLHRRPFWTAAGLFPLTPFTRHFTDKGVSCSRSQFPFVLAWAVTAHKSQGLTMDGVVVDTGETERTSWVTYVAPTRVRTVESLAFQLAFSDFKISRKGLPKSGHCSRKDWKGYFVNSMPGRVSKDFFDVIEICTDDVNISSVF